MLSPLSWLPIVDECFPHPLRRPGQSAAFLGLCCNKKLSFSWVRGVYVWGHRRSVRGDHLSCPTSASPHWRMWRTLGSWTLGCHCFPSIQSWFRLHSRREGGVPHTLIVRNHKTWCSSVQGAGCVLKGKASCTLGSGGCQGLLPQRGK